MKPECAFNGLATVAGLGANTPPGSGFKQIPHSQSHHFVIIDDQKRILGVGLTRSQADFDAWVKREEQAISGGSRAFSNAGPT